MSRLYIVTLLIELLCRAHHEKRWTGRNTSWNQDCQEKYQSPQMCRWHHPYAESEEEPKSLLMRWKRRVTKTMASGPITSWEIDWETVEIVSDFIFLGSKITVDGDRNHEIKRRLLLGRKVMTNLDSLFKSWDITLPTKVRLVKAMVFPVVMYGCESWTVKKASAEELMLLNCGVGEDSWESLGLQGDPTSPS